MIRKLYILVFLLFGLFTKAQNAEMADTFRADGKIYVVIAVIALIFICIVGFLIVLERKLSKLEKEIKDNTK